MLVYKEKVSKYIKEWIYGSSLVDKRDSILCVVTGGVDSCVTAALCASTNVNKKVIIIFMGFKEEEEEALEHWLYQNIQENRFKIIKPEKVELNSVDIENIDTKSSMMLAYVDIYAKAYNSLTVGSVTRSEYDLVKFLQRRVDTVYDVYPIIDLFRSEVIELGAFLGLPEIVLNSKSITEESFGYKYDELEWLVRENENLGIVSSIKEPSGSKYWALYNVRNKKMVAEVYKMSKMNETKTIPEEKMCKIRKSMPGLIK